MRLGVPKFLGFESKIFVLRKVELVVFFEGLPGREVANCLILKIE